MSPEVPLLQHEFLDNTFRAWMVSFIILAAIMLILRIVRMVVVRHLAAIARRTSTAVDDLVVELILRTRFILVLVMGVYAASFALHLPEARIRLLRSLAVIALLVQGALWGNHLITFWLTRYLKGRGADDAASRTTLSTLGFVGRAVLWTTLLLLALDNLGIKITGLITGLGIGGVAVALAAQEVLKDLFASLAIALDKPFLLGDAIAVDAFSGTVEHIGIKTTRIRSITGEELVFSNSDILNSRLRNYRRMQERRVVLNLGVAYETPAEKLAEIPVMLKEILEAQRGVVFDRAHLRTFGEFSLLFEIAFTIQSPDYVEFMDAQHAINLAILRRFQAEGVRFAFPRRTVRLEERLPVEAEGNAQTRSGAEDRRP